jgi:pimeloyl-ACP methyl ester carboxylesterase
LDSTPINNDWISIGKIFSQKPSRETSKKPPLIFLHGSFHASWCWTEHYFDFFASKGYPCYAFSFQGTGGTPAPSGQNRVKIMDHVADLSAFVEHVTSLENALADSSLAAPVLIAHSFAGLAVMKYLETVFSSSTPALPTVSGVAMLCSVPPSGNGKMTLRPEWP